MSCHFHLTPKILDNIDARLKFKNTDAVIYNKKIRWKYRERSSIFDYLNVNFLSSHIRQYNHSIREGWKGSLMKYELGHIISPFFVGGGISLSLNIRNNENSVLITYKDRIDIDLLYDIKKIELELEPKHKK